MGRLEEARVAMEEGVALGRVYDDIETVGWGLGGYATLARMNGEPGDSLARAREGAEIAERLGSSFSRLAAYMSLALGHNARAEWDEAISAATRWLEVMRQYRTALHYEPQMLALLAESRLGAGDYVAAAEAAQHAIDLSRRYKTRLFELAASISLARALRLQDGISARDRIVEALIVAEKLVHECGATSYLPHVQVELAELARLDGDESEYERQLRGAQRLFTEIGAPGHAARVAGELTALPARAG
jgi:tetratricopeptide (TPR) repeat protein